MLTALHLHYRSQPPLLLCTRVAYIPHSFREWAVCVCIIFHLLFDFCLSYVFFLLLLDVLIIAVFKSSKDFST